MRRPTEHEPRDDAPGEDPPQGEEAGAPALPSRMVQVFISPGGLFEALEQRPVWVDVLLVVTAISLATTLLIPQELVRETMMQQAPEGADAGAVDEMAGFIRTAGIVAAVVGPLFVTAVIAGATYLIFSLVLGGRSGSYRKLFSAAAHAMLIPSVGALATVPLILATGDVQTSLALHLLVPEMGPERYLFRFLRGVNVFGLAGAAVMGVAVGTIYRDQSTRGAVAALVGLYVALKAAMAIAGGG